MGVGKQLWEEPILLGLLAHPHMLFSGSIMFLTQTGPMSLSTISVHLLVPPLPLSCSLYSVSIVTIMDGPLHRTLISVINCRE